MNIRKFDTTDDVEIYAESSNHLDRSQDRVVALGYFDGVHKGHQQILHAARDEAKRMGMISAIHSFLTPPISKGKTHSKNGFLLTTFEEKLSLFEKLDIDEAVLTPFHKDVENLSPCDFLDLYAVNLLGAKSIVVGEDYCFGKNRKGNLSLLRKWGHEKGIRIIAVPPMQSNGQVISSSWIRELLKQGNVEKASELLSYPVLFSGIVEKGYQIGSKIQFPTANTRIDNMKMPPLPGVYVSLLELNGYIYPSISNAGFRPTLERNEDVISLETHLLMDLGVIPPRSLPRGGSFDQTIELYDQNVRIYLLKFIRPEHKFSSLEVLAEQIRKDIHQVRQYHEKEYPSYSNLFTSMI